MAVSPMPLRASGGFWAAGVGLFAGCVGVRVLAPLIESAGAVSVGATWSYIGLAVGMGLAVGGAMRWRPRAEFSWAMGGGLFALGLGARLVMLGSVPVLEDDWYRYLWDGAVVQTGGDPYAWSPAEILVEHPQAEANLAPAAEAELQRLRWLAGESVPYPQRINFPYVKTIYPPVAQGAFAVAAGLERFSLDAWRWVLLGVDMIAFGLGWWALREHGRSGWWLIGYWWNPVVILQGFNAGHMDGLMAPAVFALVGLTARPRPKLTMGVMAVATAIKLWPVLWLPVLAKRHVKGWGQGVKLGLAFAGVVTLLMYPQLRHLMDPDQGLTVYANEWRRHAWLFGLGRDVVFHGLPQADGITRVTVGGLIGLTAIGAAWRMKPGRPAVVRAMTLIVLTLLFLSPTGYPWYLLWLAPLWCFVPWRGIGALMVFAPLYFTRFLSGDEALWYTDLVVPVAFGVPLLMLVWDVWNDGRRPPSISDGEGD